MTLKNLAPVDRHIAESSLLNKDNDLTRIYFPTVILGPDEVRVIHLPETQGIPKNALLVIDELDGFEILDVTINGICQIRQLERRIPAGMFADFPGRTSFPLNFDSIRPGFDNSIMVRNHSGYTQTFTAYYRGELEGASS
jgi:hypothetical protein